MRYLYPTRCPFKDLNDPVILGFEDSGRHRSGQTLRLGYV